MERECQKEKNYFNAEKDTKTFVFSGRKQNLGVQGGSLFSPSYSNSNYSN
jgi:hypothetical protein